MLIGMGFFKAAASSALCARVSLLRANGSILGFGVGVLLNALGIWRSLATGWDLLDFALVSQQLHYWGNLFVALGWTALVMLPVSTRLATSFAGRRGTYGLTELPAAVQ